VLILVAIVWLPVLGAGFVWDDTWLVINGQPLRSSLKELFLTDYARLSGISTEVGYWRPVLMLDYRIDDLLFKLSPIGWHLHSYLLHLLVTFLSFKLLLKKLPFDGALAGMLIVGLHPIQTEAVVWVAARNDLLCTVMVLGGLLAVLSGRVWLGGFLAFCAVLSKENALMIPILGILVGVRGLGLVSLSIGAILPMLIRFQLGVGGLPPLEPERIRWVLSVTPDLLGTVLSHLALPWPLVATLHLRYLEAGWPVDAIGGLVVGGLLVLFAGIGLVKKAYAVPQGILWFVLASAPAGFAIARTGGYGDRYLYLGMVGLALAAGAGITALRAQSERAVLGLAVLAGVVWIPLLELRVFQWQSGLSLFEAEVRANPTPYSQELYAWYLTEANRHQESLALTVPFLSMSHSEPDALATGLRSAIRVQDWPLAIRFGEAGVLHQSEWTAEFWGNYAMALSACGRMEEAEGYAKPVAGEDRQAYLVAAAAIAARGEDWSLWKPGFADQGQVVEKLVARSKVGCATPPP
jgi:hypothetical protein